MDRKLPTTTHFNNAWIFHLDYAPLNTFFLYIFPNYITTKPKQTTHYIQDMLLLKFKKAKAHYPSNGITNVRAKRKAQKAPDTNNRPIIQNAARGQKSSPINHRCGAALIEKRGKRERRKESLFTKKKLSRHRLHSSCCPRARARRAFSLARERESSPSRKQCFIHGLLPRRRRRRRG